MASVHWETPTFSTTPPLFQMIRGCVGEERHNNDYAFHLFMITPAQHEAITAVYNRVQI